MPQASLESQLLDLLSHIRALFGSREVGPLMPLACGAMCHLADAERAFFFLPDPATGSLSLAHGQDRAGALLDVAEGRVAQVVRGVYHDRREVVVTQAPGEGGGRAVKAPASELRLRLLICLPLMVEGACVGVIYADGSATPGQGVHTRVLAALAEHTALALDNARAFERATGDLLTGLPNSSAFQGHLARVLKEAAVAGRGGVLLIDLDDFKRVNVAAGAEMGDRVLCEVAHSLREILSSDGLVARYGSDKFAVLLPPESGVKMEVRMRDVAERARAAIATRVFMGIRLSACIGGVTAGLDDKRKTPQDVVAFCDNMLARARSRGPGEVEIA